MRKAKELLNAALKKAKGMRKAKPKMGDFRPLCPKHGRVQESFFLQNLGEPLDGEYCGRCKAELYAANCHKVTRPA